MVVCGQMCAGVEDGKEYCTYMHLGITLEERRIHREYEMKN